MMCSSLLLPLGCPAFAADPGAAGSAPAAAPADGTSGAKLDVWEYRADGVHSVPAEVVEDALSPFLGPARSRDDIEAARAALEQAYHDRGFQTVAVEIPAQEMRDGIVHLQVLERPVNRLRVKGAVYSSPQVLAKMAPSLQEGKVINFEQVTPDVMRLNRLASRTVTPSLQAGSVPNTVDVDLNVKETAPVAADLELNNRRGPDTTSLRLNGSLSFTNLAQTGQTANLSFQTSPQNTSQVKVFSGYYLLPLAGTDGLSLLLLGTKQDSNVSTLGDVAVAGRGETAGARLLAALPGGAGFVQSATFGLDYKHFNQKVQLPGTGTGAPTEVETPITYYPLAADYTASWIGPRVSTDVDFSVTAHLRGLGSPSQEFGTNRYNADANFVYLRGALTQLLQLGAGWQLQGKLHGQLSDQPLLSQEQITGGGWGSARGYLEAEEAGDSGAFGSLELRTPGLWRGLTGKAGEWRLLVFTDLGWLKVSDALPGQIDHYDFASYGLGTTLHLANHFDGAINASIPLLKEGQTKADTVQVTFRAGVNY